MVDLVEVVVVVVAAAVVIVRDVLWPLGVCTRRVDVNLLWCQLKRVKLGVHESDHHRDPRASQRVE